MTNTEAMFLLNNLRSVAEGKEDEAINMAIEALQDRPTGTWQKDGLVGWICSNCREHVAVNTNYCPRCGADMRDKHEE